MPSSKNTRPSVGRMGPEAPQNEALRHRSARRPVIAHNPRFEIARVEYTAGHQESTDTLTYYYSPPRPLISRANASFAGAPLGDFGRSDLPVLPKNIAPFRIYSISPGRMDLPRTVSTFTFLRLRRICLVYSGRCRKAIIVDTYSSRGLNGARAYSGLSTFFAIPAHLGAVHFDSRIAAFPDALLSRRLGPSGRDLL